MTYESHVSNIMKNLVKFAKYQNLHSLHSKTISRTEKRTPSWNSATSTYSRHPLSISSLTRFSNIFYRRMEVGKKVSQNFGKSAYLTQFSRKIPNRPLFFSWQIYFSRYKKFQYSNLENQINPLKDVEKNEKLPTDCWLLSHSCLTQKSASKIRESHNSHQRESFCQWVELTQTYLNLSLPGRRGGPSVVWIFVRKSHIFTSSHETKSHNEKAKTHMKLSTIEIPTPPLFKIINHI